MTAPRGSVTTLVLSEEKSVEWLLPYLLFTRWAAGGSCLPRSLQSFTAIRICVATEM